MNDAQAMKKAVVPTFRVDDWVQMKGNMGSPHRIRSIMGDNFYTYCGNTRKIENYKMADGKLDYCKSCSETERK